MTKIIKEIIIMLLICLIVILAMAVVLYDFIPNGIVLAEVSEYTTSQEIEAQLADDIDSEEKSVVLTYEVTSKDLNSYEMKNEYVPGKDNPFADTITTTDEIVDGEENQVSGGSSTDIIEDNKTSIENTTEIIETNTVIEDDGTK